MPRRCATPRNACGGIPFQICFVVTSACLLITSVKAEIPYCRQSKLDPLTKIEICLRCDSGYSLGASKTVCSTCPSSCLSCGDNNLCLNCDPGRYPLGTTCVKCSPQCVECGLYGCVKCQVGYSVSNTDGSCIKCIPNCYSCEDTTGCLVCATSFDKVVTNQKTSCESSSFTIFIYIILVLIIVVCLPFTVVCTCWEAMFGKLRVPKISKILAHDPNIQVPENSPHKESAYISHISPGTGPQLSAPRQQQRNPYGQQSILELRQRNIGGINRPSY